MSIKPELGFLFGDLLKLFEAFFINPRLRFETFLFYKTKNANHVETERNLRFFLHFSNSFFCADNFRFGFNGSLKSSCAHLAKLNKHIHSQALLEELETRGVTDFAQNPEQKTINYHLRLKTKQKNFRAEALWGAEAISSLLWAIKRSQHARKMSFKWVLQWY